jgi:zinc D-Ala-D-Ala carboxypeptidase
MSNNFTLEELTVTKTGLPNTPNETEILNLQALVDNILQPLRDKYGKPITVISGFRSSQVNKAIGGSTTSQHSKGEAADITTGSKEGNKELFDIIKDNLPFDQLIDEFDYAWIHVSFGPRHRKEVLRATKKNNRTVYTKVT